MKRISRGTPYVMTTGDVEMALTALSPRTEEAIASLMNMTVEAWRKQSKGKRASQIVAFTNSGQLAAMLAASAKAHVDLEDSAFAVTQATEAKSVRDEVTELRGQVEDLAARLRPTKKKAV